MVSFPALPLTRTCWVRISLVMRLRTQRLALAAAAAVFGHGFSLPAAEVLRVATYNLENYLEEAVGTRAAKTPEAKAKIRESLRALKADVVALQEVGGTNALLELRRSLAAEGLEYPHWELVTGWDTNIQVAVLSRVPIVARRPHTNDSFLLMAGASGSGGVPRNRSAGQSPYALTLFTTHLKSRRVVPEADEAELREQEALILRQKIDARLAANPDANVVVLGDFNDVKDARSTRAVVGRGRGALFDTRPAERNGDDQPNPNPRFDPRILPGPLLRKRGQLQSHRLYPRQSRPDGGMAEERDLHSDSDQLGIGSDHGRLWLDSLQKSGTSEAARASFSESLCPFPRPGKSGHRIPERQHGLPKAGRWRYVALRQ